MEVERRQEQLGAGFVQLGIGPRRLPLTRHAIAPPTLVRHEGTGPLAVARQNPTSRVVLLLGRREHSACFGVRPHLTLQHPQLLADLIQGRVQRGDRGGELLVALAPGGPGAEPDHRGAPAQLLLASLDAAAALVLARALQRCKLLAPRQRCLDPLACCPLRGPGRLEV